MKVEGTDDIYDLTPAPGTVTEEGTFLNSDTLLKQTTAALLGGDSSMVPDEALVALKNLIDGITPAGIGAAQLSSGTYRGTGKYGSGQKNSLTFGFEPKLLIVSGLVNGYQSGIRVYAAAAVYVEGQSQYGFLAEASGAGSVGGTSARSGKTITWYGNAANATVGPGTQFDISGQTYSYIAFG